MAGEKSETNGRVLKLIKNDLDHIEQCLTSALVEIYEIETWPGSKSDEFLSMTNHYIQMTLMCYESYQQALDLELGE